MTSHTSAADVGDALLAAPHIWLSIGSAPSRALGKLKPPDVQYSPRWNRRDQAHTNGRRQDGEFLLASEHVVEPGTPRRGDARTGLYPHGEDAGARHIARVAAKGGGHGSHRAGASHTRNQASAQECAAARRAQACRPIREGTLRSVQAPARLHIFGPGVAPQRHLRDPSARMNLVMPLPHTTNKSGGASRSRGVGACVAWAVRWGASTKSAR